MPLIPQCDLNGVNEGGDCIAINHAAKLFVANDGSVTGKGKSDEIEEVKVGGPDCDEALPCKAHGGAHVYYNSHVEGKCASSLGVKEVNGVGHEYEGGIGSGQLELGCTVRSTHVEINFDFPNFVGEKLDDCQELLAENNSGDSLVSIWIELHSEWADRNCIGGGETPSSLEYPIDVSNPVVVAPELSQGAILSDNEPISTVEEASKLWEIGNKIGVSGNGNNEKIITKLAELEERDQTHFEEVRRRASGSYINFVYYY
ncbi:unnamed protein product [Lupinus luteus]|uniref:Uncharacterized protein n=1 Tax=Lupinus luteus TaxID=3873 RepID=A0AAV1X5A0_LUPLU